MFGNINSNYMENNKSLIIIYVSPYKSYVSCLTYGLIIIIGAKLGQGIHFTGNNAEHDGHLFIEIDKANG